MKDERTDGTNEQTVLLMFASVRPSVRPSVHAHRASVRASVFRPTLPLSLHVASRVN